MDTALKGLRVVDMGHVVAGPFCASLFGDFGADVIKIEEPTRGDDYRYMGQTAGTSFSIEGRNKRAITLNLRTEKGKAILREILKDADIVIQNYRPGVMDKMGFGWEELQKINKRLILVSISGFGQTGPYSQRPGYDSIGMALGGLIYVTGEPSGPPLRPGTVVGDYLTGMMATIGTMFAVYYRDVVGTGVGQIVDASLYESVFRTMESTAVEYSLKGTVRERIGNGHRVTVPSGNFRTKDGKWFAISVGNNNLFKAFCQCIGREDLIDDPKYATAVARANDREQIEGIAAKWIEEHTLQECLEALNGHVPCAPIYSIEDIFKDPHYKARNAIVDIVDKKFGPISMQGVFPKLSATPGEVKWSGPPLGDHNNEVYKELLGYDDETLKKLKEEGII